MLGDPKVIAAMRDLYAAKMKGAHMLALGCQGLRHMYGKKAVQKLADLKGVKMRVQATVTEDTLFPAYGAQVVHMPFGEVYTSLQTGVVDMAENGINNYLINKHYEPAPVLSLTEHEANNAALFVSDKVWSSLSAEQKKWVQAAADEISRTSRPGCLRARARGAGEAREDRRQDRQGRRQVRLREDQQADPGQARQGSRPAMPSRCSELVAQREIACGTSAGSRRLPAFPSDLGNHR